MKRALAVSLLLAALASPARAGETTLYTSGIFVTGTDHFNCQVLNAGKKQIVVEFELRVAQPPSSFTPCLTGPDPVDPGQVTGAETDPVTCGASGYYYGVFSFKGKASGVRAFCWVREAPAQRVEAR